MVQLKPQKEVTRDWPKTWSVPTLVVRCIVFNHGKFIERCLQGFLMQETNFPFEVFVHDDASTDESAEIIRRYVERYPLILKPVYESENQYSKKDGSFFRSTWQPVMQGGHKYIAFCEGDDYWTDPKKLQRQVEHLEAHPGCAGCFHERVTCDAEGRIMEGSELPDEIKCVQTWQSLMDVHRRTYTPPTCTVMWRKDVLLDRPDWMNKVKSGGDFMTAFWAAYAHGTVDWVDGLKPSVYRIHAGGVHRGLPLPRQIMLEHMDHQVILEHFPIPKAIRRENHLLWEKETFRAWRLWHGSESEEVRSALQSLVRYDVASWPALRWRLWGRQVGYWLNQGRWRAWHGLVMGIKRVLPTGMYERGRRLLQKRHSGGRA